MRPLVASLAVLLAGGAVLWQATDGLAALTSERARRLSALTDMPAVPAFPVETMTGEHLLLPTHDGKAIVVEFIYTNCPTICQAAGAEMARLRDRLVAGPLAGRVRLVSLSFDPARDTPAQMAEYGSWHGRHVGECCQTPRAFGRQGRKPVGRLPQHRSADEQDGKAGDQRAHLLSPCRAASGSAARRPSPPG